MLNLIDVVEFRRKVSSAIGLNENYNDSIARYFHVFLSQTCPYNEDFLTEKYEEYCTFSKLMYKKMLSKLGGNCYPFHGALLV